ncbi:hypothetical protein L6452_36993 [Arctium lappa]|uniref:Uncharacterized protein n=1 Tax=Arctium lappa TaxID=4217 RepID=A0ACB8Y2H8_ARCLA|nr:hypothetical protein L6452_36993 [Arctium lappa]
MLSAVLVRFSAEASMTNTADGSSVIHVSIYHSPINLTSTFFFTFSHTQSVWVVHTQLHALPFSLSLTYRRNKNIFTGTPSPEIEK